MTTFPNPERCRACGAESPPEWVTPVVCQGKLLAGTGRWRSRLADEMCPDCYDRQRQERARKQWEFSLQLRLITLGGGEKPYREFRFETFRTSPENQLAFLRARSFNPQRDNLYLWGACGVGKTHLAFALARHWCAQNRSVDFLKPPQLMRRVRRREAEDEQQAIDRVIRTDVFVLDDLGIGSETAFARQILQEILDGRDFAYRAGLVVTSKYSLDGLASKLGDDTLTSRLGGMCQVIRVGGEDGRIVARTPPPSTTSSRRI